MKATTRTTRTVTLTDITEEDAQALLEVCIADADSPLRIDIHEGHIQTSLDNYRQALLSAGIKRSHHAPSPDGDAD